MKIEYRDHPVFLETVGANWLPGTLLAVAGGFVVTVPDGSVLSVQPNGSFETRPSGTTGVWEVCQVDPAINVLRYSPGVPYAVVYRAA